MLQLAIEIFLLVLATTFCGFAAGFASGWLRHRLGGEPVEQADEIEEAAVPAEALFETEPVVRRRIPDPAPPSVSRGVRLRNDPPSSPS